MAMQRSFSAGEISPTLYGGADEGRYQSALATLRNFWLMRGGGVTNRPGTQFLEEVKTSANRTYLLKFVFNDSQTYVIEAGDFYFRFYQAGARIAVSGVAAWADATAYVAGDLRSYSGVNYYCKLAHTSATANDRPSTGTNYLTYWYALSGTIFEIPTPYAVADLATLKCEQSGDVVSLFHKSYQPRELRRTANTGWTIALITTTPDISAPVAGTGSAGVVGTGTYRYRVTAVKTGTFEQSLAGTGATKSISGATAANPVVITSNAHGFNNGDPVRITGVVGMTQLNGNTYYVAAKAANTFELKDANGVNINGGAFTAYSSGGTITPLQISIGLVGAPTEATPNVLGWTAVTDAAEYNVYLDKDGNGVYGFVGIAKENSFNDVGFQPDFSVTPPDERVLFETAGDYPAAGGYYQQRLLVGGSTNEPEKAYASRTGAFHNFTKSSPIQDDDAIDFTLASKKISEVRHLIEAGRLMLLTSTGEWIVFGDVDGVLRPTAINARQKTAYGSSTVPPVVIGDNIIAVQARGGIIRDYRFDSNVDGLASRDLTVFASHLFEGFAIERMDFAQTPHSIVWGIRSDGELLGMTYLKEFDVFGWHHHDTDGTFEDVCVVPETTPPPPGSTTRGKEEDAIYVIVKRTINGATKRYVERFASRRIEDYRLDGLFLDSFLTYNGINASVITMTLSTGAGWTTADLLTLTASSASFEVGDVGNSITLWAPNNTVIRVAIENYIDSTHVTGHASILVPVYLRTTATVYWSMAVDELGGLSHLEGKTVSVLANGVIIPDLVVTAGAITLDDVYDVIHVGLPIEADFETLDLDSYQDTIRAKRKLINGVSLLVEQSRGFNAGFDEDNLRPYVPDADEVLGTDVFESTGGDLRTEIVEMNFDAAWRQPGRVFVRHTDPTPLTILAVIPNGEMGG